jgi:hypothetical protein
MEVDGPGMLCNLVGLSTDHPCIRYLRGRGFNIELLERVYGVRYCWEGKAFANGLFNTTNTLVFPIWMDGKLVGWQSRLLYNPDSLTQEELKAMGVPMEEDGTYPKPPKYFTSPGFDKGRALFNYDVARKSELIVVCEGPLDAVSVGPCAVATLGKGVTEFQARLIKAYWKLAVILLDPGDADREMAELQGNLQLSIPTVKIDLQGYKDAGEAPTLEIWRQIVESMDAMGLRIEKYNMGMYWTGDALRMRE